MSILNCHGCKWLDESKTGPKGDGYCCMVERSKQTPREKARFPHMERCELYEKGEWKTRWTAERSRHETDPV